MLACPIFHCARKGCNYFVFAKYPTVTVTIRSNLNYSDILTPLYIKRTTLHCPRILLACPQNAYMAAKGCFRAYGMEFDSI